MITNLDLPPKPIRLAGLSTETKPTTYGELLKNGDTTKLPNASTFQYIDTQKKAYYDAESGAWIDPS